jgi:hypothetical protein
MRSIAQIAARLQGYDPQALSADGVNAFLSELVEPVHESEEVGIFEALGRVLAQDLVSPISVPPHDNSAMDGYAFDSSQLSLEAPLTLELAGTALAGKAWQGQVAAGQCVKIMTGAIMPAGTRSCRRNSSPRGTRWSRFPPACCNPATTAGSRVKTCMRAGRRCARASACYPRPAGWWPVSG